MNIHVEDDNIKKLLFDSELIRIPFGSKVYGLDNEYSDDDYISIYAESSQDANSFLWEHHNFQIKEDNVDYVFTSLTNFIRNLLNGDMSGNFESIYLNTIRDSNLSYLYDNREQFHSYSNIRSFLGYAKRDLKHALGNDKRLCHAYRCYLSAFKILNGTYNPDCRLWGEYNDLVKIKNGEFSHKEKKDLCNSLNTDVANLRSCINGKLDGGSINRYMNIENMKRLDQWLLDLIQSPWYTNHIMDGRISDFKYEALEHGIKY